MSENFNVISYPADVGGCGFYRMMFPKMSLQTITPFVRFIESFKYVIDPNFYRDIRIIRLQRQVSNSQCEFYLKFLKPVCRSLGIWMVYEIDDVICYDDIPNYNCAKEAFNKDEFYHNVKTMLEISDFITVTTDELKSYYSTKYKIELDKIIVIPNYLPRWWIGETYNIDRQCIQFEEFINNKKKPRIGLPLSSSHYDLSGKNNYVDDITHIVEYIRNTHRQYQWCFIGHVPKQLEDLLRDKKIEILPGSDLLNYPREMWRHNFQCIVAPLQDNIFNNSKSNIKLLESWALGIPSISQNLPIYNKYTDMVFDNANDLDNKLNWLFKDRQTYRKHIKENRNFIDYGKTSIKYFEKGAWIEKNLDKWLSIHTLPQRTISYDLTLKTHKISNQSVKLEL